MKLFKRNGELTKQTNNSSIPVKRVKGNAHGTHWEHVISDTSKLEQQIVSASGLEHLTKLACQQFADLGECTVTGHRYDLHPKMSSLFVFVMIDKKRQFASGWPILWSTSSVPFKIGDVEEWPIQIECDINGKVGEAGLSFFPVDYFFSKQRYLLGEINEISLGFITYAQRTNVWKDGKILDRDGKEISMSQMEAIMPLWMINEKEHPRQYPDDYRVTGKVLSIEELTILNQPAVISTVSLKPIGTLDVFGLVKNMDKKPEIGDMIDAVGWLQGRDASMKWNTMKDKNSNE